MATVWLLVHIQGTRCHVIKIVSPPPPRVLSIATVRLQSRIEASISPVEKATIPFHPLLRDFISFKAVIFSRSAFRRGGFNVHKASASGRSTAGETRLDVDLCLSERVRVLLPSLGFQALLSQSTGSEFPMRSLSESPLLKPGEAPRRRVGFFHGERTFYIEELTDLTCGNRSFRNDRRVLAAIVCFVGRVPHGWMDGWMDETTCASSAPLTTDGVTRTPPGSRSRTGGALRRRLRHVPGCVERSTC
jgi:hypothetical protein